MAKLQILDSPWRQQCQDVQASYGNIVGTTGLSIHGHHGWIPKSSLHTMICGSSEKRGLHPECLILIQSLNLYFLSSLCSRKHSLNQVSLPPPKCDILWMETASGDLADYQCLVSIGLGRCGLNAVADDPGQKRCPPLLWGLGSSENQSRSQWKPFTSFSSYIFLPIVGTTRGVVMEGRLVLFCFLYCMDLILWNQLFSLKGQSYLK